MLWVDWVRKLFAERRSALADLLELELMDDSERERLGASYHAEVERLRAKLTSVRRLDSFAEWERDERQARANDT